MKKTAEEYSIPSLGLDMTIIVKFYMQLLAKKLKHLDIDRYFFLLLIINYSKDCITQQHLCNQLKIDKTVMVRIVDYLTRKGYLKREINPKDRREYFLMLTLKAKKNIPKIITAVKELDTIATLGINKSKLETFYSSLKNIKENLKNEHVV
ncbi:MAG TPA: MarR family transcriptional regulator [Cytophagaceae bacterium]|jgi:DNA-binding MarR family transcriptional regulator|nr:MarR family transcriptional regulator [Cytophagaceae bacterium]